MDQWLEFVIQYRSGTISLTGAFSMLSLRCDVPAIRVQAGERLAFRLAGCSFARRCWCAPSREEVACG